jgi:hypothetical protein
MAYRPGYREKKETQERPMTVPTTAMPTSEWDQYSLINSEIDLAGRWIEANGGRFNLADEKAGEGFLHFIFHAFRKKYPYPSTHHLADADMDAGAKAYIKREADVAAAKASFETNVVAPLSSAHQTAEAIKTAHDLKTKSQQELVAVAGLTTITDIRGRKKFVQQETQPTALVPLSDEWTKQKLITLARSDRAAFYRLKQIHGEQAINARLAS